MKLKKKVKHCAALLQPVPDVISRQYSTTAASNTLLRTQTVSYNDKKKQYITATTYTGSSRQYITAAEFIRLSTSQV